ncbi:uncharacterized protein [Physcomitrium patens]|nr:uncharacterized protein LOC112286957 isoform X2 [Physcomitrium patens]XP_024385217.1 uncharacterized protein LOC112286957 isoform X2 [Physcomitrium patens]XP_024385218.1 uncharacterized protein LOC112286957 isoform X2 [Physcomitrium patens]|eukprot:XP_024385216.1 uncharacterized protein LOC112286957 isoform X2 [Physcomitrella patens]
MGNEVYELTNLQIRDMQSYVSRLFLLVANENSKVVFLVDNGPWTSQENRFRPTELWQLMVTQSRVSPFANRRRKSSGDHSRAYSSGASSSARRSSEGRSEKLSSWSNFKRLLQQQFKALPLMRKSPEGFHGCVAFEVEWTNVRGINYSNELLTDTCVALEVKTMVKREFDSLQQAQAWYASERLKLRVASTSFAAGASEGDGCMAKLSTCFSEECYCNLAPPRWSLDGSVSTDECSGDSDVTESDGSPEDDASDYGTVKSFVADVFDFEEDLSENFVDFSSLPSLPQNTSCQYQDSWTCSTWCPESRERTSVDGNEQHSLDSVCSLQLQDRYDGIEEFLGHQVNDCTSSSNSIDSMEKIGNSRVLLPLVSQGSFDMGRPPEVDCKDAGCMLDKWFWAEVNEVPSSHAASHVPIDSEAYGDVLIVFRFKDPMLPFELQKIVTADSGLLKMLESGLPSWVIFLQSYPIFCQLYRPWMRPLCGSIYFIVSVVTVLIGFYDLYKNVPILKATAARLCGPLFEWIEAWEMVSRLKYLGTMLVLQNFEKAFRWLLMAVRAVRQIFHLLTRPLVEPLTVLVDVVLPVWSMLLGVLLGTWNLISVTVFSVLLTLGNLLQLMVWPFCVLLSSIWNLGIYPILAAAWALVCLPLQIVHLILILAENAIDGLMDLVQFIFSSISPAISTLKSAKAATPPPSMWRALWNDLFSKVFRAVRSILNGLVAFLTACNRHRLSIYNEVVACVFRLGYMINSGRSVAVRTCQHMFPVQHSNALESKQKVEGREEELRRSQEVLRLRRGVIAQP